MGNVIEFKKHIEQKEGHSIADKTTNIILQRVYDFDCPIPLYSDEDGRLFAVFYKSTTERPVVIPFFDDVESLVDYKKEKIHHTNAASLEL